jgi:hypothetical protein
MVKMERHGDTFSFSYPEAGVALELARIREGSGEVHAEITAQHIGEDGHLHHLKTDRVQLISARSRDSFAKILREVKPSVEWGTTLEYACIRTLREWRTGEPFVNLRTIPAPPQLRYLVEPLLPEGETTVIFGDGEAGKSLFSLYVAAAAATATQLPHNLTPVRRCRVLFLDWESSDPTEHARRLQRISTGLGLTEAPYVLYRLCLRSVQDDVELIAAQVAQERIDLVIIDSLGIACGGNPSAPEVAITTMNAFRRIGATRLAIGHVSRVDREEVTAEQTTFGSIYWRNLSRAMWQLVPAQDRPDPDDVAFAIHSRKSNNDKRSRWPFGFRYLFHADGGIELIADEVRADDDLAEGTALGERLRRALTAGKMTTTELAALTGKDSGAVAKQLTRMLARGGIVKLAQGMGKNSPSTWGLSTQQPPPPTKVPRCHRCSTEFEEYDDAGRPVCRTHAMPEAEVSA